MWPRVVKAVLGIWLMIAPWALDYGHPLSTNDRIFGPLVAATGIVSAWPVLRPVHRLNLLIGAWLVCAPWVLHTEWPASLSAFGVGVVNLSVGFIQGSPYRPERYGGGWRAIFKVRNPQGASAP